MTHTTYYGISDNGILETITVRPARPSLQIQGYAYEYRTKSQPRGEFSLAKSHRALMADLGYYYGRIMSRRPR